VINKGLEHTTLSRQRRMRPEFSRLILKLYPKLQSHESVTKYPKVKGISHNLYFFNHKNQETVLNDIKSYCNEFEAGFVSTLTKYFLLQGSFKVFFKSNKKAMPHRILLFSRLMWDSC
jgi:hypothetical protein